MAERTLAAEALASSARRANPRWRRLRRSPSAWIGGLLVAAVVLMAALAPLIADRPPDQQNLRTRLRPPSAEQPFGTDEFGRSMLSRTVHGARISLLTGVAPVVVALAIGALIGLLAGFIGGRLDALLMRLMDVLLAF